MATPLFEASAAERIEEAQMLTSATFNPIRAERLLTADALADYIVGAVATAVMQGVSARGHATIVLTGGSTPALYLPQVAALNLPWSNVTFTLSDERWVSADQAGSNEKLVRDLLLQGNAAAARFIPFKTADATPHQGAASVRAALATLATPYDLVLLGMGNDAHFCSLFPHAPETAEGLVFSNGDRVIGITPPDNIQPAGVLRLSMTLAEVLNSKRIVFALQGASKLNALQAAQASWDQTEYPICALLAAAKRPIDVFWAP